MSKAVNASDCEKAFRDIEGVPRQRRGPSVKQESMSKAVTHEVKQQQRNGASSEYSMSKAVAAAVIA